MLIFVDCILPFSYVKTISDMNALAKSSLNRTIVGST